MSKRDKEAEIIDETLLRGYNVSFKKAEVNIVKRLGDLAKYQVYNEKDNKSMLFDSVTEATDEFLFLKKRLYG